MGIVPVPTFDGEDKLDAASEAGTFLEKFGAAIKHQDWKEFAGLFADNCWWKDSFTLTWDKRTLHGRQQIADAWKDLSSKRTPGGFTADKADAMEMEAQFARLSPQMASLDVPFGFTTGAPKSKCVGLAKLIPEGDGWKIWVLTTAIVNLEEHRFMTLPRETPSLISAEQRGKINAQGLPKVAADAVFDAVVVGGAINGMSNTIALDSVGANVAVTPKA